MKAIKVLLAVALLASVASNVYLWQQLSRQRAETEAIRANAADVEALRAENESLKKQNASPSPSADGDTREMARLRNEVGQLRRQTAEADAQRGQAAREVAQLRSQLATAAQKLEDKGKDAAATQWATPEEMASAKLRAQSLMCLNNLKQIGLAARLYANAHGNVFPPDLASMRNELVTPKILFCPSAPGGVQATEWTQLNPTTISYQFLNPNGNEADPQKPLTTCPIHRHVGLSDGSVHTVGLR